MKQNYAFTRSDLLLSSSEWTSLIVAQTSRHLSLESCHAKIRKNAENCLQTELNFASHLGLPAIMIELNGPNNVNLSRIMYTFMLKTHNSQVWCRIPINSTEKIKDDPWNWWDQFRCKLFLFDEKFSERFLAKTIYKVNYHISFAI